VNYPKRCRFPGIIIKAIGNILTVLVIATFATGCATGRLADLKDSGRFSIGLGVGLEANAKLGMAAHPSIGVIGSNSKRIGHQYRNLSGSWEEFHIVWPLSFLVAILDQATSGHSEASTVNHSMNFCIHGYQWKDQGDDIWTYWIPMGAITEPYFRDYWFRELTDIEIDATLGFISARVGVNPLEFIDFLVGFVGLDIAGDDPNKKGATKPRGHEGRPRGYKTF
jgi:hypothetical protein